MKKFKKSSSVIIFRNCFTLSLYLLKIIDSLKIGFKMALSSSICSSGSICIHYKKITDTEFSVGVECIAFLHTWILKQNNLLPFMGTFSGQMIGSFWHHNAQSVIFLTAIDDLATRSQIQRAQDLGALLIVLVVRKDGVFEYEPTSLPVTSSVNKEVVWIFKNEILNH